MKLNRREFVWTTAASTLWGARKSERLGVMCPLGATEAEVRTMLGAARTAGFERIQLRAPWSTVDSSYMQSLPSWIASAGLRADVLGAYVNCCSPETVYANCRREDFSAVLDLAERLECRHIVAWTGGYGKGTRDFVPNNWTPAAEDGACRFIESYTKRLAQSGQTLALETMYTMMCPDGPSLARLLARLPACVGAVLDAASMIPIARYGERDNVLRETVLALKDRVAVVHLKDVRLRADGKHYDFPGPLGGELNYQLYARQLDLLRADTPLIAEHLKPEEFGTARRRLLEVLSDANG